MTTQDLTQRLETLDTATDYSDPQTYSKLLGYEDLQDEAATQDDANQGETAAAPAPSTEATAAAAPAPAPAAESSAAPAPAEAPKVEAQGEVEGVATKDGKRVIPYAVLKDARDTASQASARAQELTQTVERLQQELEAAKAGKPATKEGSDAAVEFTDAELAEMEADFPGMGKLAKGYRALQQQLAQVQTAPAPAAAAPAVDPANTVQDLIDNRPLLARWQSKGGAAWAEALKADAALKSDPEWANKPLAERFAEVEKRVAEDLGIPLSQAPAPAPAPAATPAAAPPAMPAGRTTQATPTLDDLSGGPVVSSSDPLGGMSRGQQVDKAMSMSLEELQRMAGIPV